MGTWNDRPFGNDAALDWLVKLPESTDDSLLSNSIQRVLRSLDVVDANAADEAIAAAAVIAGAASDPPRQVPPEAKDWIREHGFAPAKTLLEDTITALHRVEHSSELRQLWDESGPEGWLRQIDRLRSRLTEAVENEPIKRSPKKPGIPRALYKIIERLEKHPDDDSLRARLIKKLMALKDVNQMSRESRWTPPIALLAQHGLIDGAKILLDRGADPNRKGDFGSPLSTACRAANVEMAKLLIDAGAKVIEESLVGPEQEPFRCSQALWAAVRNGTPELIDLLVGHGADLNQTELTGETLLHIASEEASRINTEHLIKLGLDVDARTPQWNETPLHYAVQRDRDDIVELLLAHGADPNVIDSDDRTPLNLAGEQSSPIYQMIREAGGRSAKELA